MKKIMLGLLWGLVILSMLGGCEDRLREPIITGGDLNIEGFPGCSDPEDGFELVGETYVKNGEVDDSWGDGWPGAGGYVEVISPEDTNEDKSEDEEIMLCTYNASQPPSSHGISLECPPPKDGYYLAGFTYMVNHAVVSSWGKDMPTDGGYVSIHAKTTTEGEDVVHDEVVACVYEPFKTVKAHAISLECKPLEPGYILTGFKYTVDGNIIVTWGDEKPSPDGKVSEESGTYDDDGETHEEKKRCVFKPLDEFHGSQIAAPDYFETPLVQPSPTPEEECKTWTPGEVKCEPHDKVERCAFEPPDDFFDPPDATTPVEIYPNGKPYCQEWEGGECLPLMPDLDDDGFPDSGGGRCVKVGASDCDDCCDDCNQPASCDATYNVLMVLEGASCDSHDLAWLLVDDGDGDYFGPGDVGFDHTGGAFYYVAPYDFEYYASDTVVGSTCENDRLVTEMVIYVYEIKEYFQHGKVTYIVGYENAQTGASYLSPAMEFDLCESLQD
jgi:hypothetical protein